MAERGADVELDSRIAWDDDHFEPDFDDSVLSIDDKPGSSDTHGSQQISSAVDHTEKLSDSQVMEAVNKLLKVRTFITFSVFE